MIRARAEAVKNISSVVEENDERGDRVVELDQFKSIINSYEPLAEMGIHDVSGKEKRVEELERKIEEPGFWDDTEKSQNIMKELKRRIVWKRYEVWRKV